MTQEEKQILLKDLCGRLPYGVKCIVTKSRTKEGQKGDVGKITYICLEGVECIGNEPFFSEFGNFKPYLIPLSSMTEEQKREYNMLLTDVLVYQYGYGEMMPSIELYDNWRSIDYLNANHFDYRGLIEDGLAIDATGKNIY